MRPHPTYDWLVKVPEMLAAFSPVLRLMKTLKVNCHYPLKVQTQNRSCGKVPTSELQPKTFLSGW